MNDQALALADDLASYVFGAECEVSYVTATYGEPPAPTGTNCRAIFVWVDRIDPRTDSQCVTFSRLTLAYRIYSCYPVSDKDLTQDQHEAAAACLYELASLVWCGLVRGKDTGELMGIEDCKLITLAPMVSDLPQGGVISMTGAVIVDYDCPLS